jgi:UDP-N-acetylmuramyl pentapeptide phosphotransferase/UDP-N-acetylglucosamine-1-phosphate transferase
VLPARIDERRFGLLGWVVMAVLTVVGVVGLIDDIRSLTASYPCRGLPPVVPVVRRPVARSAPAARLS